LGGGFILPVGRNFGLTRTGKPFKIATSIPFSIIRKESLDREFRSLLFGQAGLLDVEKEDNYFKDLKLKYCYLLHKHQLEKQLYSSFFKHRPDNFLIRLSQLANLYCINQNLFHK
jgi:hypothetical protein